jgi:NifU-like protein
MWEYTDKVIDFFRNPRNMGTIADHDRHDHETIVTGEVGSIACGDALRLHLKVDEQTGEILDARFQTFGCASAIASSSAMTELIKGKTVTEALSITNRDIANFLGGLPEEKMHCSVMGREALEAAVARFQGVPIGIHVDDEGRLVCRCFAVTDAKIRRVVLEDGLRTVEQVTNYTKAGGGCSSCLAAIEDVLTELWQENGVYAKRNGAATNGAAGPNKPLTTVQKIALIQQVLEKEVRPVLAEDGGDVELYDVDGDRVKVSLRGACGSCPDSITTIKIAIEARLREEVSPSLVVEAVG